MSLPDSIRPQREVEPRTVRRVVVTGATGFLGRYLVAQLLQRGATEVCCLVRAQSDERADARLRALLAPEIRRSRALRVLHADLDQEELGWTQARLRELLATADAVIHNAALVHFGKPYGGLRNTNVGAWLSLLRASAATLPHLHFVSTWAVFSTPAHAGKPVYEADWPSQLPSGGYRETKFVGEMLAREAHERGFPVSVHRPALIGLHSQSGASNPKELFSALVTCVVQTGLAPDMDLAVPFAPVDAVADGMARVVLDGVAADFSYHWTRRQPILWHALLDFLDAEGIRTQRLPYSAWREQVAARVVGTPLEPFIAWLPKRLGEADFGYLEAALRECQPVPFANDRTAAAVPGVLDGPAIDAQAWRCFLSAIRATDSGA